MNKLIFLVIIYLLIFNACSVYTPNSVHMPLFTEKGQVSAGVHANQGLNLQGAYAITDHVGVMANYMRVNNEVDTDETTREGNGNLTEIGLGYFTETGSKTVFELYGGAGIGDVDITKSIPSGSSRTFYTKATRIFFQPSFGYVSPNFEIGLSGRMAFVNYRDIESSYTAEDLAADHFVDIDSPTWIFFEPALTIRGGIENLKVQLQVGKSFKLNKEELGFDSGMVGLGIVGKF